MEAGRDAVRPALHIVFTQSGAVDLRRALAKAGRPDEVAACPEDFTYGPIDPGDRTQRDAWFDEILELDPFPLTSEDEFWARALDGERRLIAWTSTRVAKERAGFLEWVWRLGDTPCEVIDLSDFRTDGRPVVLPLLVADKILELGLLDLARPLAAGDRRHLQEIWRRLRDENAPFRTIQGRELASAPLDTFDKLLLSHLGTDWTRAGHVVGAALADELDDDIYQVTDYVLASRLESLIAAGAVEARPAANPNGREGLWADELRLPPAP